MRFFKQLLYGLFYLAIFGGVGYLVYLAFVRPAPSCFDGRQNQDEEGVDCGGSCGNICLPSDIRPITLSGEAQLFSAGGGLWGVLFWPQNPNPNYAVIDFSYSVKIYDPSGSVLKTLTGNSFLYAGEIKYINIPAIDLGASKPARATFEITDPTWITADEFAKPDLVVQSPSASVVGDKVEYRGRVLNRDTVSFSSAMVVAIFNDASGNRAGVSQTEIRDLAPGASKEFTILYPPTPGLNLDSTQAFVYARRR
jgi:hypothetical protein